MKVGRGQLRQVAYSSLKHRLEQAMLRDVPAFGALAPELRGAFLDDALQEAQDWRFRSEQGLAAYALAMWFLDPGFPDGSRYLQALLQSGVPEVRKVHAMNEWVSTRLGQPQEPAVADEKLKAAFYTTQAWGLKA